MSRRGRTAREDADSDTRRRALDYSVEHARVIFPLLTSLVLLLIAAVAVIGVAARPEHMRLPVEFRLVAPRLSGLHVRIDQIESCSCWHGPRDEAQRKYKFRVTNETNEVLDIGGGEQSALRLIVAYPSPRRPRLTMPVAGTADSSSQLGSPPDVITPLTDTTAAVPASRIRHGNRFFGVPPSFAVWALPPAPNKLAEPLGPYEATYPTVVDHPRLLPGESYYDKDLGHGTWTFYIPLPHDFAEEMNADGTDHILPREEYERHVIIVGVAALSPARGVHLIGFAPAPSDDQLRDPGEL